MKVKNKVHKRIISMSAALMFFLSLLINMTQTVGAYNKDLGSRDLKVDYHTKVEVANYINIHSCEGAYSTIYDVVPQTYAPYSLGKLSDKTLNGTLELLNTYRYIAGLPANVTLDAGYIETAQAAAVVNAANNNMSHYPSAPTGMSDDMYKLGKKGAGSSNLGWGYRTLGNALAYGWMSDGDTGNRDRCGHRRWVLNPEMGKVGFGMADLHSSMYAFDDSKSSENSSYCNVAWPAQNTPTKFFNAGDPWTVSLGRVVDNATVKITCENNQRTWYFSGQSDCDTINDSGYFNINNGGYGQIGCIIFIPNNLTFSKEYSYKVEITGNAGEGYDYNTWKRLPAEPFSITYTVDFFDVNDYANSIEPIEEQIEQVENFVKRFYLTIMEREADEDGINYWTDLLISKQMKASDVAIHFVMSDEFKGYGVNNQEYIKRMYAAFFDRTADKSESDYWMERIVNNNGREIVLAGFVNSPEFKALCADYGIDAGEMTVNTQNSNQGSDVTKLNLDTSNVDPDKLDEYVRNLYLKILGRQYDEGGLQYWKEQIMAGATYDAATAARVGFFESDEYLGKHKTSEQFVTDCYHAFLGREPEPDGLSYWMNKLDSGEYSKQKVIDLGFGHSEELKNILRDCGFGIIE